MRGLFWHAIVWSIWLLRNDVIFNNGNIDYMSCFELIRHRAWSWFSAGVGVLSYSYSDWCLCPVGCLTWTMLWPYFLFIAHVIVADYEELLGLSYYQRVIHVREWYTSDLKDVWFSDLDTHSLLFINSCVFGILCYHLFIACWLLVEWWFISSLRSVSFFGLEVDCLQTL